MMPALKLIVHFLPYLLPIGIAYLSRCVLLALALWFMVRAQDLPHTIPAIIGSAFLASVFDLIPFAGHPLAAAVLLLCVIKMTRSHFIDVRFTVGISYAITFLLQMLILSALPGDLRVHARTPQPDSGQSAMQQAAMADAETQADEEAAAPPKVKPAETNSETATVEKAAAPGSQPAPDKSVKTYAPVDQATIDLAGSLKLKSVMQNGRDSMIMLWAGGKNYSMKLGESINLKTANGAVDLKVEQITADSALVNVGGKLTPLGLK
jgi:hypothetical protein